MNSEEINIKRPNIEVLMSAMHLSDFEIAYRTGVKSDLLIINQCDKNDYSEMEIDGFLWRMISTTERGVSRSRQMAIDNARGHICLLCDDDEELSVGYTEIIERAYNECQHADAIVFNLNRKNRKVKKKYYVITRKRKAPSYRGYGSPMLSFKLDKVKNAGIKMNLNFGSGSPWGGGEDTLLEIDMRREGLKIYEYPETIATIDYSYGSRWYTGGDERYYYNLGAFLKNAYGPIKRNLYKVYECIKMRKEKTLSFFEKMKWMRLGEKGFGRNVTYQEFLEQQHKHN